MPRKPVQKRTEAQSEENTRERLLLAGLEVFARYGFEGASTRMLALKAGVNLAAIPYYFGGKEGLYHAIVQQIADRMKGHMQPAIERAEALLQRRRTPRAEIVELLAQMLPGPVVIFASAEAQYAGPIIAQEQQQPTSAFPILYDGYIRIVHELGTRLVARYLGIAESSPEAIIRTHSLAGQMFVFLGAKETILERLDCKSFSEENVRLIQRVISEQVRATLVGLDVVIPQRKRGRRS